MYVFMRTFFCRMFKSTQNNSRMLKSTQKKFPLFSTLELKFLYSHPEKLKRFVKNVQYFETIYYK